jgi:hypothetical protein
MSNPFSLPGDEDYTPSNYGTSGYFSGAGDWGLPEIPPFSTFGFADDQPHPFDPIGTWGSYPVFSQYDDMGGKGSGFYAPQDIFAVDPGFSSSMMNNDVGYNATYQPRLPQLTQPAEPLPPVAPFYGPLSYEDVGTDSNWQFLFSDAIWNNIPVVQLPVQDSYGNIWSFADGNWNLDKSSGNGSW